MQETDLSKNNPFESFKGNFSSFFSFGPGYDEWMAAIMLDAILPEVTDEDECIEFADVGAGACYWAISFLHKHPNLTITAVDPSKPLIVDQADSHLANSRQLESRLNRLCMSVQDFSKNHEAGNFAQRYNCIYFMQSAHYINDQEFPDVLNRLARGLKSKDGKIVIQARNMTPQWYPWPFPYEWKQNVEGALKATSMFGRADKYRDELSKMTHLFRKVATRTHEFLVEVDAQSYWERLEARWIPTFMAEHIIPNDLHRHGIDAMKERYRKGNEEKVVWKEKFVLVSAYN